MIYGAAITDHTSAVTLAGLTDHWIHTGGPKKEVGRYHIPAVFFTPNTKISMLLQAVENASPSLVLTAELCGLYYSPIVSTAEKCRENHVLQSFTLSPLSSRLSSLIFS